MRKKYSCLFIIIPGHCNTGKQITFKHIVYLSFLHTFVHCYMYCCSWYSQKQLFNQLLIIKKKQEKVTRPEEHGKSFSPKCQRCRKFQIKMSILTFTLIYRKNNFLPGIYCTVHLPHGWRVKALFYSRVGPFYKYVHAVWVGLASMRLWFNNII